jgi:hypothetical protein
VTSPAGTELGETVRLIGPAAPPVSLTVTCTVDALDAVELVGIFTPPSSVLPLPAFETGLLAHDPSATTIVTNKHLVTALFRSPTGASLRNPGTVTSIR